MQTEKGVIYRNSDGTQKNLETELGLKANTTGSYPNLSVGNATNATNAVNATNATNATKATQDGSGNTITTYYLPKNGPDLVVGQTLTSLVSGKSYLDCAITATVSSGTYYFYNCTGTVTVSGTTAKVYASNCPNLTINGKTSSNWKNIWIDGKRTISFDYSSKITTFDLPLNDFNYCLVGVIDGTTNYIGGSISFGAVNMEQYINVLANDFGELEYFSAHLEPVSSGSIYRFTANVEGAKRAYYIVKITLL